MLDADRFTFDCLDRVKDPRLRAQPLIGAVDQFIDSTDMLIQPDLLLLLSGLYLNRDG